MNITINVELTLSVLMPHEGHGWEKMNLIFDSKGRPLPLDNDNIVNYHLVRHEVTKEYALQRIVREELS